MKVAASTAVVACAFLTACVSAPSPQPVPAEPSATVPSSAVLSLLDAAQAERAAGDLNAAAASVERALRIERRSAGLYLELARIRLAQQEFRQAEAFSLKAASLAPQSSMLQAEAWSLIAQARQASGDKSGAQDARQKADKLRNP